MLEPTTVYTPSPNRYDSMTYNHAGESGLKLPAISSASGTTSATPPHTTPCSRIVFTAFDNGITHFDLANNYGPEPGSAEKTADDSCTNTSTTTATNSSSAPKPATKCGPAPTATSAAANTSRLTRPKSQTPQPRLRGHLLPPPHGPIHTTRRDHGRARHGREQRQGAVCGPVQL